MSALDVQVGGNHYKQFKIQPIEFITKNNIGFIEGNVIKYICRHQFKNGVQDVEKVKHYCDLLLDLSYKREVSEFEKAVNAPATQEELSASALADLVTNHKLRDLILKRILNQFIAMDADHITNLINSVVTNHSLVDDRGTLYLEIKLNPNI